MQYISSKRSGPALRMSFVFVRMPALRQITGLSRSTIYRLMSMKEFPCPVRLGPRAVAWRMADIHRWSDQRPGVMTSNELSRRLPYA